MEEIRIKIKKLSERARIPTRGSEKAAGYDLYAACEKEICIKPHHTEKISTDLAIELPDGYFAAIYARSGYVGSNVRQ